MTDRITVECPDCSHRFKTHDMGDLAACENCQARFQRFTNVVQSDADWRTARKKPVEIEFKGPFVQPDRIETMEGDFEVDQEYIAEHDGYVIIRGVNDELYPCGLDIFHETYEVVDDTGTEKMGAQNAPYDLLPPDKRPGGQEGDDE